MARRQSNTPVKIYSFGCLLDAESEAIVEKEIAAGRRYYNSLLRMKIDSRERFRAMRRKHVPGLAEVESRIDDITAKIDSMYEATKQWRIETGARGLPGEMAAKETILKGQRAELAQEAKELCKSFSSRINAHDEPFRKFKAGLKAERGITHSGQTGATEACDEALKRFSDDPSVDAAWVEKSYIEKAALDEKKAIRHASECSGMMKTLVEEEVDQAVRMSAGRPLRFKPTRTAEGRFGGPIRQAFAEVLLGKGPLKLRPDPMPRSAKSDQFFVGSLQLRESSRVSLRVRLHRPLPSDANIKRAWILRRKRGRRWIYNLQMSVESELFPVRKTTRPGRDVAVVFGKWRTHNGAIVARWRSACGKETGNIEIPLHGAPERTPGAKHSPLEKIAMARGIGAFVKQMYGVWAKPSSNAVVRDPVTYVLKQTFEKLGHQPRRYEWIKRDDVEWFAGECSLQLLGERRKTAWIEWVNSRKAKGLDLFCDSRTAFSWGAKRGWNDPEQLSWWLYLWLRKTQHLEEMRAELDSKGRRGRDQIYRNVANELARKYDRLILSKESLTWTEHKSEGENKERAKHQLAVGECRRIFKEVFGKERTAEQTYSSAHRERCSKCGENLDVKNGVGSCECGLRLETWSNECANLVRVANDEWFKHRPLKAVKKKAKKGGARKVKRKQAELQDGC